MACRAIVSHLIHLLWMLVSSIHLDAQGNWVLPELRVLNLRTKRWYPPLNVLSRYGHAAVLLPGPQPHILVLGGRDARGDLARMHYIIDATAVIDTLVRPQEGNPSTTSDVLQPRPGTDSPLLPVRQIWRHLGFLSDSSNVIGPFNGTSNIWAVRDGHKIYVLGQATSESRASNDLLVSDHQTASLPYTLWTLTFGAGWTNFEDISSTVLPYSSLQNQKRERWLWLGLVETDVKAMPANHSTGEVEDVTWEHVAHERVLLALNSHRDEIVYARSILSEEHTDTIRAIAIPIVGVDTPASATPYYDHCADRAVSFDAFLPPLWDGVSPTLSSLSLPDFHIQTSTLDAPLISVHSLIIGSRSPYLQMLLSSGFLPSQPNTPSNAISPTTTMDEDYYVIYAYIHWLYTDTLPRYLHTSTTPAKPAKILADLLLAADKYLAPSDGKLCQSIREQLLKGPGHIDIENALYTWGIAWALVPEGMRPQSVPSNTEAGEADGPHSQQSLDESLLPLLPPSTSTTKVTLVRCLRPDHHHTRPQSAPSIFAPNTQQVSPIARDEEHWIDKSIREAHAARSVPHVARAFLDEVSRWCARRVDDIELVHGYAASNAGGGREMEGRGRWTGAGTTTSESQSKSPSETPSTVRPEDESAEDDDEHPEAGKPDPPYAVEPEVHRAFWEEMRRLGATPSGLIPLTADLSIEH